MRECVPRGEMIEALSRIACGHGPCFRNATAADPRSRYAVLPSLHEPRWLLPAAGAIAACGLDMYKPYTRQAKILKSLLMAAFRLGLPFPKARCVVLDSLAPLHSLVTEMTGEAQPFFALAIGRPGPSARVIVQAMRPSGEVLGYLKFPISETAGEPIRNESRALRELHDLPRLRPCVPRILFAGEWKGAYLLFQTKAPRTAGPTRFTAAHERFLRELVAAGPTVANDRRTIGLRGLPELEQCRGRGQRPTSGHRGRRPGVRAAAPAPRSPFLRDDSRRLRPMEHPDRKRPSFCFRLGIGRAASPRSLGPVSFCRAGDMSARRSRRGPAAQRLLPVTGCRPVPALPDLVIGVPPSRRCSITAAAIAQRQAWIAQITRNRRRTVSLPGAVA